jgi:predicted RNase H-like HicB family nuclease
MKETENFMNKNYRIALQYDSDGYWIAEHPELPGCKADGETAHEALSSLDISRELWIESRQATGLEVPEPQEAPQYSGRFVLRIPKSLHRELANEAEAEGVSLNSLVSNVLAGRHARKEQYVSYVTQPAYQYLGSVYPAFHTPGLYPVFGAQENPYTLPHNVHSTFGLRQSPLPAQNNVLEFEQKTEGKRKYA